MATLGVMVKDVISGYRGTAAGYVEYYSGVRRVLIVPTELKDGEYDPGHWFDEALVVDAGTDRPYAGSKTPEAPGLEELEREAWRNQVIPQQEIISKQIQERLGDQEQKPDPDSERDIAHLQLLTLLPGSWLFNELKRRGFDIPEPPLDGGVAGSPPFELKSGPMEATGRFR